MMGNTEALGHQALYRFTGQVLWYQALFSEVLLLSKISVKSILGKNGVWLGDIDDIALDVTIRLMQRFKDQPLYRVRNFISAVYFESQYRLYNKNQQQVDKTIEVPETIPCGKQEESESGDFFLLDILAEPWGKQAVLILYRSSSYRQGVLKLAEFIPKRTLYDFALRLNKLYKSSRMGRWSRRRKAL